MSRRRTRHAGPIDWDKVLEYRVLSKRGIGLTDEQRALVDAAYEADPERYGELEADVFDRAAASIGSTRRYPRGKGKDK